MLGSSDLDLMPGSYWPETLYQDVKPVSCNGKVSACMRGWAQSDGSNFTHTLCYKIWGKMFIGHGTVVGVNKGDLLYR